jgi:hypothetical protein
MKLISIITKKAIGKLRRKYISIPMNSVEGFEFPVLLGLERFFTQTKCRPMIVCEIKPWELPNLGYSLMDFENFMQKYGYEAYEMMHEYKKVDLRCLSDMEVVLFKSEKLQ